MINGMFTLSETESDIRDQEVNGLYETVFTLTKTHWLYNFMDSVSVSESASASDIYSGYSQNPAAEVWQDVPDNLHPFYYYCM